MIFLDLIKPGLRFYHPHGGRLDKLPPQMEVLRGPEMRHGVNDIIQIVNLRTGFKELWTARFLADSRYVVGEPSTRPVRRHTMTADVDLGQ